MSWPINNSKMQNKNMPIMLSLYYKMFKSSCSADGTVAVRNSIGKFVDHLTGVNGNTAVSRPDIIKTEPVGLKKPYSPFDNTHKTNETFENAWNDKCNIGLNVGLKEHIIRDTETFNIGLNVGLKGHIIRDTETYYDCLENLKVNLEHYDLDISITDCPNNNIYISGENVIGALLNNIAFEEFDYKNNSLKIYCRHDEFGAIENKLCSKYGYYHNSSLYLSSVIKKFYYIKSGKRITVSIINDSVSFDDFFNSRKYSINSSRFNGHSFKTMNISYARLGCTILNDKKISLFENFNRGIILDKMIKSFDHFDVLVPEKIIKTSISKL